MMEFPTGMLSLANLLINRLNRRFCAFVFRSSLMRFESSGQAKLRVQILTPRKMPDCRKCTVHLHYNVQNWREAFIGKKLNGKNNHS